MVVLTDAVLINAITQAVPSALAAWLYGSAIRGQLRAASDVDVAVFVAKPLTWQARMEGTRVLGAAWQRDVDLVDFSHTTTVMQQQILTTGRRLFCLDTFTVDSYEAFARSEYLRWKRLHQEQLTGIFTRGYVLAASRANRSVSV